MRGVEIREAGDAPLVAYAVVPERARYGVVVIHEILGRQPEIDRVVERFGRHGYAAIAPDLAAGAGPLACIRAMMLAVATGRGRAVQETLAARRWLCDAAGLAPSQIGLIGFCLGGGFVLAMGEGWGAVSTNYGPLPGKQHLRKLGPVIGCYGGRDRIFGRLGPQLQTALSELGVPAEVHTFATAGHSFLTDGDHPLLAQLTQPLLHAGHDPQAADEAWGHIHTFFARHLQAPPVARTR